MDITNNINDYITNDITNHYELKYKNKYRKKELILGSGGMKGLIMIGALIRIHENVQHLEKFEYLTGCSIGSLLCVFINLGFSIYQIVSVFAKMNIADFMDLRIRNFIENNGFDDGTKLTQLFSAIFLHKNFNGNTTFFELYQKTNKTLTIATTNYTKNKVEYLNWMNTPNLKVIQAMRMSICIPLMFQPVKYDGNYYIDGAIFDPFPYNYIKISNDLKIGIFVLSKNDYHYIISKNEIEHKNSSIINMSLNILDMIYKNYLNLYYKKKMKNVIYIIDNDVENSISFDMNEELKNIYINKGIKYSSKYIQKLYLKKRKEYLSKKYYFLWKFKCLKKLNL